ncbi:olfactory receptor 10A6-like [Dendropsophus ebraccatus]|uniref:olfactory receptor 10A6-like n=1 Tax=Dendropsophus ebraccatus TaxID=150705 RepID=UPI0038313075
MNLNTVMENVSMVSNIQDIVLLGLKEMEQLRYCYSVVALLIYLITLFICTLIVYVVWTEQSLHEPMYIFICILVGNVMFGSSVFLLKMAVDLFSGCTTISLSGCLAQAFWLQSYAFVDILTFTIMAVDRYLAVGFPLRYHSLMTIKKTLQSLTIIWSVIVLIVLVNVLLVLRLTLCGNSINNVYCETMSLVRLSCGSTFINDVCGSTCTLLTFVGSLMIVIYCYIQTFLVCLRISKEASQKAIHTVVTHIIAYSTFMSTSLFVVFRWCHGVHHYKSTGLRDKDRSFKDEDDSHFKENYSESDSESIQKPLYAMLSAHPLPTHDQTEDEQFIICYLTLEVFPL